jgi:DNA-binding beta-propeller fold protein YncE
MCFQPVSPVSAPNKALTEGKNMIPVSGLDKRGALPALIGLLLASCTGTQGGAPPRAAADGTLAISADGALLFAVNPDVPKLAVIDAKTQTLLASLDVGNHPARVLVGPADTVYVANRGSRSVSVFKRSGQNLTPSRSINTGAEPAGLAISADGRTLYVACSAQGSVQAFDLGSVGGATATWESQLGNAPRTIAVLPDGRLYVGHYLSAEVDVLDSATGASLKSISAQVGVDPTLTVVGGAAPGAVTFRPTALESILVSTDGARAYLLHRRDRNGLIATSGVPSNSTTPVVTPAITTIELNGDKVLDETLTDRRDFPPSVVFPDNRPTSDQGFGTAPGEPRAAPGIPVGGSSGGGGGSYGGSVQITGANGAGWTQGPSAAVEDGQGHFLFVANRNTNNVTVLPVQRRTGPDAPGGIVQVIAVGDGPSGLAFSQDEQTLYVHNQIDDSVSVIQRTLAGSLAEVTRISQLSGATALAADVTEGRRLFFSAADSTMTTPGGGLACESCHLEGSHDGNVWQFTQGPRKTPSLLARRIKMTAPYHWDGTENDLHAFLTETVQVRMGGQGVSSEQEGAIAAFMEQLAPLDNPNVQPGGLTAAQQRGQALFKGQANCAACHSGDNLTDNGFHDVGTRVMANPNGNPDDPCFLDPTRGVCATKPDGTTVFANPLNTANRFNTPSLLGVVWAAPYLHDGSAVTLLDRLRRNTEDKHGHTSQLTSDQLDDLVAYLQTL